MAQFSNAQLAQAISDLIAADSAIKTEFQAWLSGTVGGGAGADGKYPLTDYAGASYLVECPAQLQDDVDNSVSGAAGHKTAAQTAETNAVTAQTAAELAETNAETAETSAIAAKDLAETAKTDAESARTTAIAQAATATTKAVATAADAVQTALDAIATAADRVQTGIDAAAAATFVPSLYGALADNEIVTGAWEFQADMTFAANAPKMLFSETDAGTDGKNWIQRINAGKMRWQTATDAAPTIGVETFMVFTRTGTVATSLELVVGSLIAGTVPADFLTVTAGNLNVTNWDTAYGWGDHASAGYSDGAGHALLSGAAFTGNVSLADAIRLTYDANNFITLTDTADSNRMSMFSKTYMNFIADSNNNATGDFRWGTGATTVGASDEIMSLSNAGNLTILGTVSASNIGDSSDRTAGNIVSRGGSGYIFSNYFNMTANDTTATATMLPVETNNDGYLRWQTPAWFITNHGIASLASPVFTGTASFSVTTRSGDGNTTGANIYKATAHGIEAAHTTAHAMTHGWSSDFLRTYHAPWIDGVAQWGDEFGYNMATENWYFDVDIVIDGETFGSNTHANIAAANTFTGKNDFHYSLGGECLTIKDTGGAGDTANPYIGFRDSANVRIGYVGFGSTGNQSMYLISDLEDVILNAPTGVIRTQKPLYIDNDAIGHFEAVTGNYGSVQVDGYEGSSGSYGGYSINGEYVLMANATKVGIYNDINNEWFIECLQNAGVWLRYNNSVKFQTTNVGAQLDGQLDLNGNLEINSKGALQGTDTWLRINNGGDFTAGSYFAKFVRIDGGFQTGATTTAGLYHNSSEANLMWKGGGILRHAATSEASGDITISTSAPSGGSAGDMWLKI